MRRDRQTILSLVAAGRITANEAERLLIAWNDGQEWLWLAIIVAIVFLAQMLGHVRLDSLWHGALALSAAVAHAWQKGISILGIGMGGTL